MKKELIKCLIGHFKELKELKIYKNELNFEKGKMAWHVCDYYGFDDFIEELEKELKLT